VSQIRLREYNSKSVPIYHSSVVLPLGSTIRATDHVVKSTYGSTAAFNFLNLYTVGRTPWTGDQPVARPLPVQTQDKRTQTPMPQVDSNPRSQLSNGRRRFMP
jgi:hypothetical protein